MREIYKYTRILLPRFITYYKHLLDGKNGIVIGIYQKDLPTTPHQKVFGKLKSREGIAVHQEAAVKLKKMIEIGLENKNYVFTGDPGVKIKKFFVTVSGLTPYLNQLFLLELALFMQAIPLKIFVDKVNSLITSNGCA